MTQKQIETIEAMTKYSRKYSFSGAFYEDEDFPGSLIFLNNVGTVLIKFTDPKEVKELKELYRVSPLKDNVEAFLKTLGEFTDLDYRWTKSEIKGFSTEYASRARCTVIDFLQEVGIDYIVNRKFVNQVLNICHGRIGIGYSKRYHSPIKLFANNCEAYIFPIVNYTREDT